MTITIFIDVEADISFDRPVVGLTFATSARGVVPGEGVPNAFYEVMLPSNWLPPRTDAPPRSADGSIRFPRLPNHPDFYKLPDQACAHPYGVRELRDHLHRRLMEFVEKNGSKISGTGDQYYSLEPLDLDQNPEAAVANILPWGAVLSDAAALPGTVGRVLGLSAAISVPGRVRDLNRLMFCPQFAIEWEAEDSRKRVLLSPPRWEPMFDRDIPMLVTGDAAEEFNNDFQVKCRVKLPEQWSASQGREDAEAYIDMTTGWIKLRADAEIGTRDWFAEFPVDVARALDPAAVFLGSADRVLSSRLDELRTDRPDASEQNVRDGTSDSTPTDTESDPEELSEAESVAPDALADQLSLVFVRCLGPRFALGIPAITGSTETGAAIVTGDDLKDWLRKSLLFDIAAEPLLALFDFTESGEIDAGGTGLLKAALAVDRLFAPGTTAAEGARLSWLMRQLRDVFDETNAVTPENDATRELLQRLETLAFLAETDSVASGDATASEAEEIGEALSDAELVTPRVAVERALTRVRRLSGLLDLVSETRFHRLALGKLIRDLMGEDSEDQNLRALSEAVDEWASQTDAEESAGFIHVIMDRLRAFTEAPLQSVASPTDPLFVTGDVLSDPDSGTSIKRMRTNAVRMAALAYERAFAPALAVATVEGFEQSVLLTVATDMLGRASARVNAQIGPPLEKEPRVGVRLEPAIIAERPESLAVTVGQLAASGGSTDTARLAGFGVLVRRNERPLPQNETSFPRNVSGSRNPTSDWHALTVGSPVIVRDAHSHDRSDRGPPPIGVGHYPVTVVEQSNLQSWLMNFGGPPLTAISIRENPAAGPRLEDEAEGAETEAKLAHIAVMQTNELLLELAAGEDTEQNRWSAEFKRCLEDDRLFKLMTLKYGETLEFAFFTEQNNGFLPFGVSDRDDPALFRLPTVDAPWSASPSGSPARAAPSGFNSSIRIRPLRRTAVAPPRIVGELVNGHRSEASERSFSRQFKAFQPTAIDRNNIAPLADLLIGDPDRESKIGSSVSDDRTRNDLILLVPDEDEWNVETETSKTLWLLPPAVTVSDYERWRYRDLTEARRNVSLDAGHIETSIIRTLEARDAMVADIIARTPDPEGQITLDDPVANDAMPDDPAVEAIGLRLSEVVPRAGGRPPHMEVVATVCIKLDSEIDVDLTTEATKHDRVLIPPIEVTISALSDPAQREVRDAIYTLGEAVTIDVEKGRVYQLDIVSLVAKKYYDQPENPESTCRFRALPGGLARSELDEDDEERREERDAIAAKATSTEFDGFVEAARTTLDIEVATDTIPTWKDVFNTIDILGEENGHLLVGVLPPEVDENFAVSPFRFLSEVTVARQRWRWTGRGLAAQPSSESEHATSSENGSTARGGSESADIRLRTKETWQKSVGAPSDTLPPGLRREGRAVLEPDAPQDEGEVEDAEDGSLRADWNEIAGYDGQWFAAISDAERFDETGRWPYLAPPTDAFSGDEAAARRARGVVLARVPVADRPQAQYWRFAAVVRSRYWGLRRRSLTESSDHNGPKPRELGTPWRRMIVGPDLFAQPTRTRPDAFQLNEEQPIVADEQAAARLPAPRLRLMIPLPAPLAKTPGGSEWMSFLAVFDETFGDVAGLAEWLKAEVALTSASDEEITPASGGLTAIFAPVYSIPEFGFDPILRNDPIASYADWPYTPPPNDEAKRMLWSDGEPIGLTFDNDLAAVPSKTLLEVQVKVNDDWLGNGNPSPLAGAAGDRLFAEIFFRREVEIWGAAENEPQSVSSQRTRLEWVLFGASNEAWRIVHNGHSNGHGNWVHVSALRFNSNTNHFHLVSPDGMDHGTVTVHATNATQPAGAPQTMLVRRVFVVLTELTRGSSGTRRSEVFLAAGMVGEVDLDGDLGDQDPREPYFWSSRVHAGRPVRARLVEVEFHRMHLVYRELGVRVNGVLKSFNRKVEPTGFESDGKLFHDHPLFDAILGGQADENGEAIDAAGRITRISPPIEPLGNETS